MSNTSDLRNWQKEIMTHGTPRRIDSDFSDLEALMRKQEVDDHGGNDSD